MLVGLTMCYIYKVTFDVRIFLRYFMSTCFAMHKLYRENNDNWTAKSWLAAAVDTYQCDQKKSPNVYKSCPKMISLEK